MWWRRRKARAPQVEARRTQQFFFKQPPFEVQLEGEPLPVQEEEHTPLAPALLIGLGKEGVEVLKRVKANLLTDVGHTERVALMGVLLEDNDEAGSSLSLAPLGEEEVLFFSPRYSRIAKPFLWWKPEFATARDAARVRGRMLWFWDQSISGEQRLTAQIENALAALDVSTTDRLQVLIFGALTAPEFAMALDMGLWIRRHVMEQLLFGIGLFGIAREQGAKIGMQAAALREMRRYISTAHLWVEDEKGRPVVWNKFLFDHVFLFSEKDVKEWSGERALEEIYTALADISMAFLDKQASQYFRSALSLLYSAGAVYSVGGLRTWVWKDGERKGSEAQSFAQRVVGENTPLREKAAFPVERWIEQFYTRRFREVEGEDGFPFAVLLDVARGIEPQGGLVLPPHFRDGLRWRLLLFLNEVMNDPRTSLADGLAAGYRFVDGLFRWWAGLRRAIGGSAARSWAQPLLSEIPGILEDIQSIRQEIENWGRTWERVISFSGSELHQEKAISLLALPVVKSRRYFGTKTDESVTDSRLDVGEDLETRFRKRIQWRWQEVKEQSPTLVVATLLKTSNVWPVHRAVALGACIAEAVQRAMSARSQARLDALTKVDFPAVRQAVLPDHEFFTYAIVQKQARSFLFVPHRVKENLGASMVTVPTGLTSWGFPARLMQLVVEGNIALESSDLWKESMGHYFADPALHVFVQEQRFAQLERRSAHIQWSPEFVNLLAAEDALRLAGLAFWYGWLRIESDEIRRETMCQLVSPQNEIVERIAVEGAGMAWRDVFTRIAESDWENGGGLWDRWVRRLKEHVPQWLDEARIVPWKEREVGFREREKILEKWDKDQDGQALRAYLYFLREEEQWV